MRILNLIQRYYPAHGGAERHLGEIARRLAAAGHDVTVLTTDARGFELFWQPDLPRISPAEEVHEGVRILRFPVRHMPGMPASYDAARRLLWLLSRIRPLPVAISHRVARWTPRVPALHHWLNTTTDPFDLVVGVNICYETFLEAGWQLARRRRLPFVTHPLTHLGAGPTPGSDPISQFYTMRHQVALVRAGQAAVMMTAAEQQFYARRGVPVARLPVMGTGVNAADVLGGHGERWRWRHGVKQPLLLSLSTMSVDKGTVQTVEAARLLWREGEQVGLVLAGISTAPFQSYLNQLPDADRERILVLGPVDDATRRDLLAACDIFVMPSRVDSFGITYLEAWLYGKPVIGADAWGIKEGVIVAGEDGLLVPFGDAVALAASISRLLHQPDLAHRLGQRGQAKVYARHTWDRVMPQIENLYRAVVTKEK